MRRQCKKKSGARRLLFVAIGAGAAALIFYCVPWWVFLLIGVVSLVAAGVMFARQY